MTDGTASFAFDTIGTRWQIETDRPLSDDLRTRIRERIDRFDATWSRFRPDSLVTRIARARHGGRYRLADDATALLDIYDRLRMRPSSEFVDRRAGRGCRGLEQAGEWAGGHAGPDVFGVAGVVEEVRVDVERDRDAGVAEHAADLGWVEPEVDDQVAGEGVAQVVEAKRRPAVVV
jgi:hypothetical protein